MVQGGNPRRVLRAVRERRPDRAARRVAVARVDRSARRALPRRLAALAAEIEPAMDLGPPVLVAASAATARTICWPLPFTEEALAHVADARAARAGPARSGASSSRTSRATSTYTQSTMSEPEFLAALAERADCGLLLDVNNVFVSAHNHGFDRASPSSTRCRAARVGQFHLAGHSRLGDAPARHARSPRARRGLGPLPPRGRALRRRADAGRVGRQAAAARRASCAESRARRRRGEIARRGGLGGGAVADD